MDILDKEEKRIERNKKRRKYSKTTLNLLGYHSKFDQNMHDKYDIPARNKLKEKLGELLLDNPNIYEQDMIINIPGCRFKYLEIQVCSNWTCPEYPHKSLYVYERKGKYGEDTLFITMNKILTRGFLFARSSFSNEPRRLGKYSREYVYDIPWNLALCVSIEYLDELTFLFI